jgi:protoporphyrinogen/coproporphyrinogen III oxidase
MPHVVIVGAGLTGLALAYRLRWIRPGITYTLLEKGARPGGNIWTDYRDGFRVEIGPNGFLDAKPTTLQLCRDLGLGDHLIAGSDSARLNRYLFWNGRLRKLPGSLWSFLTTPLLSFRGKLNLLLESYRRRPTAHPGDESVAAFARRRGGREAADLFADALVTGIHAGDPEQLSIRAAFPRVARMEEEHGSVFRGMSRAAGQRREEAAARGEKAQPGRMWSFRQGLRRLVEALRDQIGDSLISGVRIRSMERDSSTDPRRTAWVIRGEGEDRWKADAVVLACPAYEQAEILAPLDPVLAGEIALIPYNRIAVVAIGYRAADLPRAADGFGYIAPSQTRRDVLGVQWCSAIFPERAPAGMVLWRALCGGAFRGEMVDWDDDRLLAAVRQELGVAMGVRAEPVFHHIVRWPRAIPQYHLGHLQRVARIEEHAARHPGLFLTGNAYHGIAMNDCTEQAGLVAERVADYLHGS